MKAMRLGGIDPSILRELSGVYTPFVKAFKELISNSFDADSSEVQVQFTDDFFSVAVQDNGQGMSPFEFKNDFTRIGGGSRRWAGDKTRGGRPRIGSKGIGFLAMARYCDRLRVESYSDKKFEIEHIFNSSSEIFDLRKILGVPINQEALSDILTIQVYQKENLNKKFFDGKDFNIRKNSQIEILTNIRPLIFKLILNCKLISFKAVLDFDRLLSLADEADLEKIEDFASIEVFKISDQDIQTGTKITAENLKPFVRRELKADKRKGNVRNISSKSGFEQFVWFLSRCTPVNYPSLNKSAFPLLLNNLSIPSNSVLSKLELKHGGNSIPINRPIFPMEPESPFLQEDLFFPLAIQEGGLKATGFIAGYEGIIFPAEFRGISIRVRGVSIGDPGFLKAESLLTGANRAALSQITGEINVLEGLDAVDTLNPGRESFYEESEHFKILKRHLIGEGERVGGLLNEVINAVLRRSQVKSAIADLIGKNSIRRQAVEDVSAAVTQIISVGDSTSKAIRELLKSKKYKQNFLSSCPSWDLGISQRLGGLEIILSSNLEEVTQIDYLKGQIKLDMNRKIWSWDITLFDRIFEILHKKGKPEMPIAEIDLKTNKIFLNWGHSVKLQMDEKGFLRTSLAWVLAREVGEKDPSLMMELALRLLAFTNAIYK